MFGMALAAKKGMMKHPSKKVKKMAKEMSESKLKEFASTKRKGLPTKVTKKKGKKQSAYKKLKQTYKV